MVLASSAMRVVSLAGTATNSPWQVKVTFGARTCLGILSKMFEIVLTMALQRQAPDVPARNGDSQAGLPKG